MQPVYKNTDAECMNACICNLIGEFSLPFLFINHFVVLITKTVLLLKTTTWLQCESNEKITMIAWLKVNLIQNSQSHITVLNYKEITTIIKLKSKPPCSSTWPHTRRSCRALLSLKSGSSDLGCLVALLRVASFFLNAVGSLM